MRRLKDQALTLYTGILWLIGMGVVIQLWLVTAALEALLAGHRHVLVPAAVGSLVLLGINGALVWFVFRLDARVRRESAPGEE
jgi:hypothetical protein